MPSSNKSYKVGIVLFLVMHLLTAIACGQENQNTFHAIAYHGVVDSRDQLSSDDVTLETLVNHFEWLVANHYTPISIDQLIKANKGQYRLPNKSVLLCWDDGYTSFYTHVYPLLKAYGFPALLALVGDWMTTPAGEQVTYGNELVAREQFLSWEQIQDLAQSPLVEIASHSFDLHKGLLADSAGDVLPAVIAHEYSPEGDTYEGDTGMFERILLDLKKNNELIQEKTGVTPRVMVWPFGRYNDLAIKAAGKAGMDITLTLDPVAASSDRLDAVARKYPTLNPETGTFQYSFFERNRPPLRRFIQVDALKLIEENENDEKSFGGFLERVKTLAPGRVYFEPVVRIDNTLNALFQNKIIPVIQDRLMRLSWHTDRRAATEVHLILSDELFSRIEGSDYKTFFSDMGKSAPCSGLLLADVKFNEKLIMMMEHAALPNTPLPIWNPHETRAKRSELAENKADSRALNILSGLEAFQRWQPFLDMGLLVSSEMLKTVDFVVLKNLLRYFDYIMVDLRAEEQFTTALRELAELEAFGEIGGYFTVLVKFDAGASEHQLKKRLNALNSQGIVDFGYAYDSFMEDRPDLETIRPIMSARTFPFIPK